ncbi:rhodanese-like domain-containing protein [Desulfovibrio sp. TomC]|uniref:rhodanese-like domain-containing protein n=1 Tax=Desulfovibrio sp. TomC TaxID=1562888 RepID=UPI00057361BD|nr:rhodanese-like domain-containing protein [Desulfovibrio sp. TomC]KHK01996.1 Rhodanese domain protein [Desulfovibrio sp. TomC]
MKGLVLFLVLFFGVWDLVWLLAGVVQTPPWRLRRQMGEKSPQLLDVRTAGEYALFHIPGAINRPDALVVPPAALGLDPNRPVVVVCMTGHRSPFVAQKLAKEGFDASNLTWGMLGWFASFGKTTAGSTP